jgi:hypothetical protein
MNNDVGLDGDDSGSRGLAVRQIHTERTGLRFRASQPDSFVSRS